MRLKAGGTRRLETPQSHKSQDRQQATCKPTQAEIGFVNTNTLMKSRSWKDFVINRLRTRCVPHKTCGISEPRVAAGGLGRRKTRPWHYYWPPAQHRPCLHAAPAAPAPATRSATPAHEHGRASDGVIVGLGDERSGVTARPGLTAVPVETGRAR